MFLYFATSPCPIGDRFDNPENPKLRFVSSSVSFEDDGKLSVLDMIREVPMEIAKNGSIRKSELSSENIDADKIYMQYGDNPILPLQRIEGSLHVLFSVRGEISEFSCQVLNNYGGIWYVLNPKKIGESALFDKYIAPNIKTVQVQKSVRYKRHSFEYDYKTVVCAQINEIKLLSVSDFHGIELAEMRYTCKVNSKLKFSNILYIQINRDSRSIHASGLINKEKWGRGYDRDYGTHVSYFEETTLSGGRFFQTICGFNNYVDFLEERISKVNVPVTLIDDDPKILKYEIDYHESPALVEELDNEFHLYISVHENEYEEYEDN